MNKIGKIIELERKNKGISQTKLGEILGISQDTISLWEKGKAKPTVDSIIMLSDYFEVSADYLLGRENDIGVINVNANLTQYQKELIAIADKLSAIDQNKVLDFIQALIK